MTAFWYAPGWGEGFGGRRHRHGRRFKRGILKFVLLKLLADESRHGYDLIREFRRKGWGAGPGSIYPLLAALEEEGLIIGRDEGERRTYEVTEKGRQHLSEHALGFGSFFEKDEGDEETEGDDLHRDLRDAAGRLMQAVSQLGPSSKSETIERVRDLLDRTRREIYTLLAQE
ncbi:MAG: PadR family transcriptional regulator [Candidatus Tumulicola sp.]